MLPNGWRVQSVLELGRHDPNTVQTGPFGSQLHAEDYVEEGTPLLLIRNIGENGLILDGLPRITEQDAARLVRYVLQPGDVVFSRVGRVGSCFLATEDQAGWIISGQTLRIRVPYDDLHPQYFLYALRDKEAQDFITGASVGTTRSSINTTILKSLPVRVPSYAEQTAIADILSTVDQAIAQTEALIAKQRRIKTGLLHDLLTRGIDEHGQLRDPATHRFKQTAVGWVPEEWEVAKVGDLFSMELGKMLSKVSKRGIYPKPYLANKNVQWGRIDISDIDTMDFYPREQIKYRLKKWDILVCEGGEVGRTAVWNNEMEECYFQKAIHRLRPIDHHRITPQFMAYYMQFVIPRGILLNLTTQTSIAHLTQEQLAISPVVFPDPIEMAKTTEILTQHDDMIKVLEADHGKLRSLKTGLMQDLLSGRVSVAGII